MAGAVVAKIRNAVVEALSPRDRIVLAVSGGADSMVMLDAAGGAAAELVVATFDHATGAASKAAAKLVRQRGEDLGFECVVGVATAKASDEASWRAQRWDFLREVARDRDAGIATAHTLDDQVETVFMRILRDAGPRGLAGLYAQTEVLRPLLATRRAEVLEYVAERSVRHVNDPSNLSRGHLRNRVRLDLLPAARAVRPSFEEELLGVAARAAEWRDAVASVVDALGVARHADGSLFVARRAVESYDERALAILWPEIAARADVTMDRRGTHRVAAFTIDGATGGSIQLSGRIEVVRTREHFVLRRKGA
ncbi:MAG TPA: tRNA lysidine(34) synthetase TilS [Gemmatimonadaceae bacterium]|nr:tRNA lysidine(34) synthetase TilS [Gemmatimonadaceae bacterium]